MLIISRGSSSTRIERSSFPNEADLQRYIYEHPEAIPLDELGEESQLHVLGREFPTSSGPLDALATDADGAAYIIETKLFKNPDKRQVVAQVLDYGAALWAAEPNPKQIMQALLADSNRRHLDEPLVRLAGFLDADEEAAEEHLEKVSTALSRGHFTAIVLMDRLSDRLRNLILFINENSDFRVVAVELDYYRHDGMEIVSPRLFGGETRRRRDPRETGQWSLDEFFERLEGTATPEATAAVRAVYEFAGQHGEVGLGTGPKNPLMLLYLVEGSKIAPVILKTDGACVLKLGRLGRTAGGQPFVRTFATELSRLGLPFSTEGMGRTRWPAETWVSKVDVLLMALRTALNA